MADRREQPLEELTALFLAEGFLGMGVGDLAQRLRCSRSTLYLVAPSKEQVITAVVRAFFRGAAARIEDRVAAEVDPAERLRTYLTAVADELAPASPAFYGDLAAFGPAGDLYRDNTVRAARRVQELVADGVAAGGLRPLSARFVGAAVTEVMAAIQDGTLGTATGLTHSEAYQALADLVLDGLRSPAGAD